MRLFGRKLFREGTYTRQVSDRLRAGTELSTRQAGIELNTRQAGIELNTRQAGIELNPRTGVR
jgi:hypothetical protein